MKRLFNLAMVFFAVVVTFACCKKDDEAPKKESDFAKDIVGTYEGYSDLKIRSNAQVVIAYEKKNYVTVCYDTDMDEDEKAATTPVSAKVKKAGSTYSFSGQNGVESFDGTVTNNDLNLKVYVSGSQIYDITATKQ